MHVSDDCHILFALFTHKMPFCLTNIYGNIKQKLYQEKTMREGGVEVESCKMSKISK